jgi:dihydrofolate reductase
MSLKIKTGINERKIIFAINMTIDGCFDHTAVIADDELHKFYTTLLNDVDIVLFGRKTYQLMESFWPKAHEDSRSTKSMLAFADKINNMHKIVFSKTLTEANWKNTSINKGNLVDKVLNLKKKKSSAEKNISAGSISIASALIKKNLIDEYWFVIQPIILGKGRRLFDEMPGPFSGNNKLNLKLISTETFKSGVVVLHYGKI